MPSQDSELTTRRPHARRRQSGRGASRGVSTLLLWFELGEMRAQLAIATVAFFALALGLASVWPALARLEAMVAMLGLPALAVVVSLRKSLLQRGGLRVGVWTVGVASALLAIAVAVTTLFPSEPLGTFWLGPRAAERAVALAPETSHVTLIVRAPARAADNPLRLGLARDGQQREVVVSLEAPVESSLSPLELSEPIVERRVAANVPGEGPLRVRLAEQVDSASPPIELVVRATSDTVRYALVIGCLLAAVGVVLQVLAERRRDRSWLLFGSWSAIAFALWAPTAWDPSQPGWTALGALLYAVMAGGGAAALVSYLIARRYASSGQR